MLSAYYGIEGAERSVEKAPASKLPPFDQEGFDGQAHFDASVLEDGAASVLSILRKANALDAETKELDGDIQMVNYENYSKFLRATDVTKQVQTSVEALGPDLAHLEKSFVTITDHQRDIEGGCSTRAREVEALLKQQRRCRKLQVLFDMPATLRKCLDQGAYSQACAAYCNCAAFLRQHRSIKTFQKVLEDVEHQMGCIRSALEHRLGSPELSVEEAVNSSLTLLDLGQEHPKVARDYLVGRSAALRACLDKCFATPDVAEGGDDVEDSEEDSALQAACELAAGQYSPGLLAAVEGFRRLQQGGTDSPSAPGGGGDEALQDFVRSAVERLCDRTAALAEQRPRPPPEALSACVGLVLESLEGLRDQMPQLLAKLSSGFVGRVASGAARARFADGCEALVGSFVGLHGECKRLQDVKSLNLDDLFTEVARVEQEMLQHTAAAVAACKPLLFLVQSDASASELLASRMHDQLAMLFSTFPEVFYAYIGTDGNSRVSTGRLAAADMGQVESLEWVGLFGLALVWIGRRLEDKALGGAWSQAKALFATSGTRLGASDMTPCPLVQKAIAAASAAVITHFVLVSGQRLAHFVRNSVQSRRGKEAREPLEPSVVVEMVFKEVCSYDAQLARALADPRKPKGSGHRRQFSLNKTPMELEMELMLARKVQVFAAIPFNRNGAVGGILRITFKALYEYVREETFPKFGLQQIQVDAELFGEIARDFVEAEDASTLGSLLAEAVHSASQRCAEPQMMEASAVEAICARKKRTMRIE